MEVRTLRPGWYIGADRENTWHYAYSWQARMLEQALEHSGWVVNYGAEKQPIIVGKRQNKTYQVIHGDSTQFMLRTIDTERNIYVDRPAYFVAELPKHSAIEHKPL